MTAGPNTRASLATRLGRALGGRRRIVLCALGNPEAGDDGAGPALLEKCRSLRPGPGRELFYLDAGTRLESHLGGIEKWRPEAMVFLDAVAGQEAGRVSLFDLAVEAPGLSLSTHGLPLSAVASFLRTSVGADCFLLGVGGERFGQAHSLSPEAQTGVQRAFAALSRALASRGQEGRRPDRTE